MKLMETIVVPSEVTCSTMDSVKEQLNFCQCVSYVIKPQGSHVFCVNSQCRAVRGALFQPWQTESGGTRRRQLSVILVLPFDSRFIQELGAVEFYPCFVCQWYNCLKVDLKFVTSFRHQISFL